MLIRSLQCVPQTQHTPYGAHSYSSYVSVLPLEWFQLYTINFKESQSHRQSHIYKILKQPLFWWTNRCNITSFKQKASYARLLYREWQFYTMTAYETCRDFVTQGVLSILNSLLFVSSFFFASFFFVAIAEWWNRFQFTPVSKLFI